MVTPASESASKKRIRTGIAISATELCAADLRLRDSAEHAWRAPLAGPASEGTSWPSLATALADLARAVGTDGGLLSVSLLPPLTEVRRLELPPVRDDELQRLIARNAARYFVNARGPQIVGVSAAARRASGAPIPVVAAAASARLIALVRAAAAQSGWEVESIAPAETAWAAASVALWPPLGKQSGYTLVAHDERTDLLQLENGRLVGVRRFRAGAGDAALIADALGPTARVGIAGLPARRRELGAALADLRLTTLAPAGELARAADRADLLAAQFAGSSAGPVLRAEATVALERAATRRATWTVAAATAAVLAAAALVELWGAHHQLALVEAERARLRPQIASTLIGRTTVDAASRSLAALDSIDRARPQWSAVIANLSESVPSDAHFTAIRAHDDSLVVDGLAEHAARVFDALEKSPALVDVKAGAAVRRELQENGTPLDHFTIAARVAPVPSSAPATRTAPASSTGGTATPARRPAQ